MLQVLSFAIATFPAKRESSLQERSTMLHNNSVSPPFTFKGVALLRGDFVAMRTRTLPLPEVQAAVMEVKDGVLDVFSTMLAIFQHNGLFTEDEVIEIKVVYPAAEAIPRESRGKNFAQHERVAAVINGTRYEGRVVAACDGIIAVHTDDGQTFSSGASHLNPV